MYVSHKWIWSCTINFFFHTTILNQFTVDVIFSVFYRLNKKKRLLRNCWNFFYLLHFLSISPFIKKKFTGEKPAAMQHPDKTTAATSSSSTLSTVHYILLPTISSTSLTTAKSNNNNTNRNNTSTATFQFFIFNSMTGILVVRNVLFKKLFYLYC